jgi:hypothetical protein
MSISDEIFEEFFNKLREDKEFPNSIIEGLQELVESGETISTDKIFELIRGGVEDAHKD